MAIDPTAIGPAGGSPPISSFGVYEIRALLGAGGMGQVYRAFDSRLGREIALKVIRRSAVDDESALDRLLREATLASAIHHALSEPEATRRRARSARARVESDLSFDSRMRKVEGIYRELLAR